jgi:O-antigen/teichoic acid export membrane protein
MIKKLASPAWALLEYGWYPLLLFITTPWFLHQLGSEKYGYWMLLTATVGFGGVLNIGTGAATIKAVSAGMGRANGSNIGGSAIRASIAIAMLGGAALALLVFSAFWLGGTTWLGRMGDQVLVQQTGVAASFLIWVEQLDNVFSSAMKGAEQFGQAARVEIASKTAQVVVAATVLWAWPELWMLYAALFVIACVRLLAKAVITKRLLNMADLRPSFAGSADILHFAKWGWLQGVGGVLFGVADRMLVGSLLGATSLAFYSIASQLAMQVHAVSAAGLSVIFPKVSRKLEGNNHSSLWRVTKLTMVGNLLLSSLLAAILMLFGPKILQIWIGTARAVPTAQVLPWLVVAYWLLAVNVVPYYILLGMGRIRFVSVTVLAAGIAGVIAMFSATSHYGLVGAPAGRILYALLSLALIFPLVRHFAQERSNSRMKQNAMNAFPGNEPLP